ncbi:lipopolysaccharide biosynthesis protein [Pseudogemmobacter sp. W21_MBD1_M6]|uniref:lipopolysaccharide biosynthesis protein n=1 Tax=Pseudogemmobacter sp. W21_MBD1_M6 TaxID=3240271 RepID=UPI003F9A6A20
MPAKPRLVLGAAYMLALRAGSAVASYLSIVLLGRWMAPYDYGQFAATLSALALLTSVLSLGMPMTILRFLGEYSARKDFLLARGLISAGLRLSWGGGTVFAVAGGISISLAYWINTPGADPGAALLGLFLLPPAIAIDVQGAVLRSRGDMFWAITPRDLIWRIVLIGLGWWVAQAYGPGAQFIPLVIAATLALWVLALGQLLLLSNRSPLPVTKAKPQKDLRLWASVAWPIWMTNIAGIASANLDTICVALLMPVEITGLYFAASRTAALPSFSLNAVNLMIGPMIPRANYARDRVTLQRLLGFGAVMAFVPAVLAVLACVLYGAQILSLFGKGFAAMRTELILLSLAQMINAATGSAELLLNMTGHQRQSARIAGLSIAVGCLTVPPAVLAFGTLGAASVICGIVTTVNICLWRSALRHTGYDTSIIPLLKSGAKP